MYRKERFWLRFLGLSPEVEEKIRGAFPGTEFHSPRSSLPAVTNVLLFDLQEGMDLSLLYKTLDALQLGPKECEVSASVATMVELRCRSMSYN